MKAEQFKALIAGLREGNRLIDEKIAEWQRRRQECGRAAAALDGLARSWAEAYDPGKYGEFWFLVRSCETFERDGANLYGPVGVRSVDWFFAEELVDDPAKARQGVRDYRSFRRDELYDVPLGRLAEAAVRTCSACGGEAVVVGCHHQTEDSDMGDTWLLSLHALCLGRDCLHLERLAASADSCRFIGCRPRR